jgi:hypothetical protein
VYGKVRNAKIVTAAAGVAILLAGALLLAGCGSSSGAAGGSSGQLTEASVGAPIYPGAAKAALSQSRPGTGGNGLRPQGSTPQGNTPQGSVPSWRGQGTAPNGARNRNTTALWTKDMPSKVAAWYKEHLSRKTGFTEMQLPSFTDQGSESIAYRFTSGENTVMVMVRSGAEAKGGTSIMISKNNRQLPSFPGSNGGPGGTGQSPYQNQNQSPGQSL